MFGKRGEIPPLPRNCERRELGRQVTCSHWGLNPWEGCPDSSRRESGDRFCREL